MCPKSSRSCGGDASDGDGGGNGSYYSETFFLSSKTSPVLAEGVGGDVGDGGGDGGVGGDSVGGDDGGDGGDSGGGDDGGGVGDACDGYGSGDGGVLF